MGAADVTQPIKALLAKPGDPSSIPRTHGLEGEN